MSFNQEKALVGAFSVITNLRMQLFEPVRHIPPGFSSVCGQQGWDTAATWTQLSGGSTWYRADNEAYIYWNTGDSCWWIDKVRLSWTLCFSVLHELD